MTTSLMRRSVLPIIVFFTGACVLIIEVISTRMLAPYFGNTIYSLSSILSVTLLALSFGYYNGGKIADRMPRWSVFFGIIAASGIAIGVMRIVAKPVLATISQSTSLVSGPLIASLCLFLVPALLLGMLSPFAIRLQHAANPSEGVGSVAGSMFFWSTLGSIVGSLLAGFVLIPTLGVQSIVLGVAAALLTVGVAGLIMTTAISVMRLIVFVLVLPLLAITLTPLAYRSPDVVYATEGVYQNIRVVKTLWDTEPIHMLYQDLNPSSAIFLESDDLVFGYTPYYRLGTELRKTPANRALFIGAGAFSMPRDLLLRSPSTTIDVVDIEPGLKEIAERYFRLEPSSRLRYITEDGRAFLRQTPEEYDFIFSDIYQDFLAIPSHVTTLEFFELTKSKLSEDGMLIANIIGSLRDMPMSFLLSEMRTFKTVFPVSRFFAVRSAEDTKPQNIIFVGCRSAATCIDPCSAAINTSKDPFLKQLCKKTIDPMKLDLDRHRMLTDDYAPVEFLSAQQ